MSIPSVAERPRPVARLILLLHLGLALLAGGRWLAEAGRDWYINSDFTAFYTGWMIVGDGQGQGLYDLAVQRAAQGRLLNGARLANDDILPYVNPPHLTLPFVPLSWLPRPAAVLIWMAVQGLLLVLTLRWFWSRLAAAWSAPERWQLLAAMLALAPLYLTLMLGTFSLLMLFAFCRLYQALSERRALAGGLWLVVSTLKPQLSLLPGLVLLLGRRWRSLGWAVAAGGGLAGVATAVLGWPIWLAYIELLGRYAQQFGRLGVDPASMWNVRGQLTLLLGSGQAELINRLSWLGVAGAALLTVWLWRGRPAAGTADFQLRFALTIVLVALTSPHFNSHDDLLLVLPVALGYDVVRHEPRWRRWFGGVSLAGPLLSLLALAWPHGLGGVHLPFLATLGLAVGLAWACRQARAVAVMGAAAGFSSDSAAKIS